MGIHATEAFYIVATSFGDFDKCDTMAEAEKRCAWHNEGYQHGTRYASDPMPTITECRNVVRYRNGKEVYVHKL